MKHLRATKRSRAEDTGTVVIEWDIPSVAVARFELNADQPTLAQQFSLHVPSDVALSHQKTGSWLRHQFRQNGIAANAAVVVIPRRHISTRLIEIPTVDEKEISDICRLQAKAMSPGDDVRVIGDYLLHPSLTAGNSHVFLATIPCSKVDSINSALSVAGLSVEGIHVAEFALTNTLATNANGLTLHVIARDLRIEFVVCSQGFPVAAPTFPFLDDGAEVASVMPALGSRVLQGIPTRFRSEGLASVDLYGEDARKLVSHFEEYFDVPVHSTNTRDKLSVPLRAAARANVMDGPAIDFASPKVDSLATEMRPRRLSRAMVAVVLCALIFGVSMFYNFQLDREYARLRRLTEQTAKANRAQQSHMDAHRFLSEWNASRIDWPTQLAGLAEHLPANDRAYLQTLHVDAPRKTAPTISASGCAATAADVVAIHNRIVADPRFVLQPQGILPKESSDYKADFSLRITTKRHQQ